MGGRDGRLSRDVRREAKCEGDRGDEESGGVHLGSTTGNFEGDVKNV